MKAAKRKRQQRRRAKAEASPVVEERRRAFGPAKEKPKSDGLIIEMTRAYAEADRLECDAAAMPAATLPPMTVAHLLSVALAKAERSSEEWLAHRFSLGEDDPDFLWVIGYLLRSAAARGIFAHDNFIGATVCRAHEMLGLIVVKDDEVVEAADGADAEGAVACVEVAEGAAVTAGEADEEEEGNDYTATSRRRIMRRRKATTTQQ